MKYETCKFNSGAATPCSTDVVEANSAAEALLFWRGTTDGEVRAWEVGVEDSPTCVGWVEDGEVFTAAEAVEVAKQWFESHTTPKGWAVITVDPEGDNFSDPERYPLGSLVAVGTARGDARYACGEPTGLLVRK